MSRKEPSFSDDAAHIRRRVSEKRLEQVTTARSSYQRIREDVAGYSRGILLLPDGRVVPHYPRIGRIFHLASGLREHFDGAFAVEEKIDGYNVRLFRLDDEIVAVTRGGYPCPFALDRLPELLDIARLEALFERWPDLVLGAEIAGPGNPYMDLGSARVSGDVALFVFDALSAMTGFWPVQARRELLDEYAIPQAPFLGIFESDAPERLYPVIRDLDRQGAEGVVFKPLDGNEGRLKYVTPGINLTDVWEDAPLELELPPEFFMHRVARMVMALRELGMHDRLHDMARDFGEALVEGFDQALNAFETEQALSKTYEVRLRTEAGADALMAHLGLHSRTVDVKELSREWDGGHWMLRFRKTFRRSTDRLHHMLGGGSVFD